ncbi:MAG TPA: potassium-transporting ATPase subunit KdpA, partial [Solirubrobacteraceae bacterium]|nr:potassium-transporting ATPase subunit KdpA [Solirubrobacteraceae bacterium]
MTAGGWGQIVLFIAVLGLVAVPLGNYMARVYSGETVALGRILARPESLLYRVLRVDERREQDWKAYARSLIVFSLVGWLALYLILRTQDLHPGAAAGGTAFHSGTWDLSFNTVSSFLTNTNWQYYAGETTLTYVSQMLGLTVQN